MIKTILLMPSTYGWVFPLTYILYSMHLVEYDSISAYATYVYLYVSFMFIFSTILFIPLYSRLVGRQYQSGKDIYVPSFEIIALLHIVGFFGTLLYVLEISRYFGGFVSYYTVLLNQAHYARAALAETTSVGVQINYFGWIAIGLSVKYVLDKRKGWDKVLLLLVLQVFTSILYVSRTRPMWVLMIIALMYIYYSLLKNTSKAIVIKIISLGFFVLLIFSSVGVWLGKIEGVGVSGGLSSTTFSGLESAYVYLTGGFVYFDKLLNSPSFGLLDYNFDKTLYPLWKILASIGVMEQPISQILEFLNIPFRFNVGTFLEPLHADGGIVFVIIGVMLHTIGFNSLGYYLLKNKNSISVFMWSNLCYISALASFTPKYNTFPIWLFFVFTLIFGREKKRLGIRIK